jgi:hypothetical protein
LLPLAALVLASIFLVGRALSRRRARALGSWAEARGLAFAPGTDRRVGITFLEMPLLGDGHASARHHVSGTWRGREVHVFDLVLGPGEDEATRRSSRYTCALARADLPLIPLCLQPREEGARPPAELGPEPVEFADPVFDEAFAVTAADARWARDLLHDAARRALLEGPRWRLELGGWWCLVAVPGRLEPARLEQALAMAADFLDIMPDAVRREILGDPR